MSEKLGPKRVESIKASDEPWVKPETIARHLSVSKHQVMKMTREGKLPGRNCGMGARRFWRFRVSEVDRAMIEMEKMEKKTA